MCILQPIFYKPVHPESTSYFSLAFTARSYETTMQTSMNINVKLSPHERQTRNDQLVVNMPDLNKVFKVMVKVNILQYSNSNTPNYTVLWLA